MRGRPLLAIIVLVVLSWPSRFAFPGEPPIEPRSAPGAADKDEGLDLVVIGADRLVRFRLRVEVDGRSLDAVWNETFDRLFAFHDRDGDGMLDPSEAGRLPQPFSLRQMLWGQFHGFTRAESARTVRDADSDGRIRRDDLARDYRRAYLGAPILGVGYPPATATLTDALTRHLDKDGDHRVTEPEWKAAAESLRKLDRNDDELISPNELAAKVNYPGAAGTVLVSAASADPAPEVDRLPLLVLPGPDSSDLQWAEVLVRRCDRDGDGRLDLREAGLDGPRFSRLDGSHDGHLTPDELARWRAEAPDAAAVIRLGMRPGDEPAFTSRGLASDGPDRQTLQVGRLRLGLRIEEGKLPEVVKTARRATEARFAITDANHDGIVDESERMKMSAKNGRNSGELAHEADLADRDHDGRLSRAELEAWLDLRETIARGLVLLTVLDYGAGLFELLDADHDAALSVRELRGAWDRLRDADCLVDGGWDATRLPRQLVGMVSRGQPLSVAGGGRRVGPEWFRAMDRNGDGDISRKEFVAPDAEFRKLDADCDGMISSDEAARGPLGGR